MENLTGLIIASRQGDCDAYEEVVRRFQDMAVAYAYAQLGNWQEAEDAAQEASSPLGMACSACAMPRLSRAGSGVSCIRGPTAACVCRGRNWCRWSRWGNRAGRSAAGKRATARRHRCHD